MPSKPIAPRGRSRSLAARLPVWQNSDVEIDIRNTQREKAVWDFLFKHTDKTALMKHTTVEVNKW